MTREVSNNFLEQSFSQEADVALLTLLEIQYELPDGTETTDYFTDNNVPVDSSVNGSSQVYQPRAFTFTLGDVNYDAKSTGKLRIDSGDNSTIRNLIQIRKRPVINVWVVLSNDVNTTEIGPINYEVENFKIQNSYIDLTLVTEPVLNEPIPGHRYTPTIFPGLWEDVSV